MAQIGRLLTAMVTPFDAQGRVDYAQARRLALALLESGSDGLVVTGTTGESPTLTTEEKLRLYGEIRDAIGDRGAIVAGTGNYNTHESIELSVEAARIGVDGLLLVVPYYNNPPPAGLIKHFSMIAAAAKLPSILYNVPTRSPRNLDPATCIALSKMDYITGVKEASANMPQIRAIIEGAAPGFRVWSGNDSDTFEIMGMGGYGIVSVASHLVGRQIKEQIEHTVAGRTAEAKAIHERLLPLVDSLFWMPNPIPVKYCLNRVGFNVGEPRLPLVPPDDATAARIDAELAKHRIDLPVSAGA
ncbi:MAG: 4-hydroxy-tetrahydrodipicolinate synthase [Chloroflexi bacterium]|nr:4-hydroxy-tetrahydrodipicolinate synthase [Chloroflexota bacterium]